MKFLYATDIHGDEKKYEKALEIAKKENIHYIVTGGDLLPPKNRIKTQVPFMQGFLNDYFNKLEDNNITFIFIPGNDDLLICDPYYDKLEREHKNVYNINRKSLKIEDCEFIGFDLILDTPHDSKERIITEEGFIPEKQRDPYFTLSIPIPKKHYENWEEVRDNYLPYMKDILATLPEPDQNYKTIYITHYPPTDLGFGVVKNSDRRVGSKDIKTFFEEKQPYLTFHGHVHESADLPEGNWIGKIGETTSFQPGQTHMGEELIYIIIDTDKDDFKRFKA